MVPLARSYPVAPAQRRHEVGVQPCRPKFSARTGNSRRLVPHIRIPSAAHRSRYSADVVLSCGPWPSALTTVASYARMCINCLGGGEERVRCVACSLQICQIVARLIAFALSPQCPSQAPSPSHRRSGTASKPCTSPPASHHLSHHLPLSDLPYLCPPPPFLRGTPAAFPPQSAV